MARESAIRLVPLLWLGLAAAAAAQTPAAPVDLPISAKAASDFKALRERPLFAPSRSVPPPVAAVEIAEPVIEPTPEPIPVVPMATAPDWELVGLVRSDRINSAMFRSPGQTPAFSLRKGESRDGWTVSEIGRFEVILDSGQGRASLRFPASK